MRLLFLLLFSCTPRAVPDPVDAGVDIVCSESIPNSCQGCLANPLHTQSNGVCSLYVCHITSPLTFMCDS